MTESVSRRRVLAGGLAASVATASARPSLALDINRLGEPLGAQALAIRDFLVQDFSGTLRVLKAMGYGQIELVSFPGSKGSTRGDFGPLADTMTPAAIRREIRGAGLTCSSSHFFPKEFEPAVWSKTEDWAKGVGVRTMVSAESLSKNPSADDVKRFAEKLNQAGSRVRGAGLQMSLHAFHVLWHPFGQGMVADAVFEQVDPAHCQIQLDFGSVVQASADGAALIDRFGSRVTSIHLRDGKKPENPDAYFPALPLGAGAVDWAKVIQAARRAGVRQYIVEMQLRPVFGMLDGHKTSIDYLRALKA